MADISKLNVNNTDYNIKDATARNAMVYEKSASGSLVSFNDGGDNIPLKSLIANITAVQSGSGTPSPTNVRAISGWSECNLSAIKPSMNFDSWLTSLNVTHSVDGKILSLYMTLKPYDNPYQFSQSNVQTKLYCEGISGDSTNVKIELLDSSNNVVTYINNSTRTATGSGCKIRFNYSGGGNTTIVNPQVYVEGTTHTIPFGQTVYGCVLDVLSGVLTVTHGYISEIWGNFTGKATLTNYVRGAIIGTNTKTNDSDAICNIAPNVVSYSLDDLHFYIGGGDYIYAFLPIETSNDTVVQFVYELATPVTYKLTPAQVSTLLGLNNIFADTGDISLSYFTQNANAINDIAESNTRTALNTDVPKTDLTDIFVTGTKNNTGSTITAGTYFYVNGQLALCKQAISANADLTLNTNYELVTAGALNKLMSNVNTSLASKMNSANPTGTGTFSLNRKSGTTTGSYSVAIGYQTTASNAYSYAEGRETTASGQYTHAEGRETTAGGHYSHSEGYQTTASGTYSHAEGNATSASNNQAHVEGYSCTASGSASHAEGESTTATAEASHSEGLATSSQGLASHAEGRQTTASGQYSHSEGHGTIANHAIQHVFGAYNLEDGTANPSSRGAYVEIVGKGVDANNRSNARTLDWNGNEVLAGGLTLGGNLSVAGTSDLIKYEDFSIETDADIAAGTIGTRGAQVTASTSMPSGYVACGCLITYIRNSSNIIPLAFLSSGTVYVNYYRATSSAITKTNTQITVRIFYAKATSV